MEINNCLFFLNLWKIINNNFLSIFYNVIVYLFYLEYLVIKTLNIRYLYGKVIHLLNIWKTLNKRDTR